jgi:hypothetical protein
MITLLKEGKAENYYFFCLVLMISRDADKKLFDGCNFKSEMFWGKINCWWCLNGKNSSHIRF